MRSLRLWAVMMLPGGLAAGHTVGYEAAEHVGASTSGAGHGYLGQLSILAVPVTIAVLLRAFVAGTRGELAPVRFSRLALYQVALYVGVELVEHAAAGTDPGHVLGERSLLLGVAAQVLVAGALSLLVRALRRLGIAVAAAAGRPAGPRAWRRPWAVVISTDVRLRLDVACVPRRGPPRRSVFA